MIKYDKRTSHDASLSCHANWHIDDNLNYIDRIHRWSNVIVVLGMGLTHRRNCDFLVFWHAKTRTSGRAAGARESRLDPFLSHVVSSCGLRLCSRPSRTYLNAFAPSLISIDNISKFINNIRICALMNHMHTYSFHVLTLCMRIFQTVDTTRASKVVQRNKMLNKTT